MNGYTGVNGIGRHIQLVSINNEFKIYSTDTMFQKRETEHQSKRRNAKMANKPSPGKFCSKSATIFAPRSATALSATTTVLKQAIARNHQKCHTFRGRLQCNHHFSEKLSWSGDRSVLLVLPNQFYFLQNLEEKPQSQKGLAESSLAKRLAKQLAVPVAGSICACGAPSNQLHFLVAISPVLRTALRHPRQWSNVKSQSLHPHLLTAPG